MYIYICAVCVRVLLSVGSCKTWSESGVFGLCQAVTSRHHLGSVTCTYYSTALSYYTLSQKIYVTLPLFFVKLIQKRTDFSDFWHRNLKTFHSFSRLVHMPSVLWRCWLGSRKGVRSVKTEWWGVGVVVSLERDADLHMAKLMPLPLTFSCLSKIQIGFYLSGTGSPR